MYFLSSIIDADAIANFALYSIRDPLLVKIFIWITLLGEIPTIIVFGFAISAILWIYRKRWQAAALWIAIVGSEATTFAAKWLFHRERPITAVFLEDSNSFPSGHATIAVAFYGFLAYLLFRKIKNYYFRLIISLTAFFTITAIGFSRLYLGVHFVSDVWAGYLVGLSWLIIGASIYEWKLFQKDDSSEQNILRKNYRIIAAGLAVMTIIFYIIFGLMYHPKYL